MSFGYICLFHLLYYFSTHSVSQHLQIIIYYYNFITFSYNPVLLVLATIYHKILFNIRITLLRQYIC